MSNSPLLHSAVFLVFEIVIKSICDVVVKLAGEVEVIQADVVLRRALTTAGMEGEEEEE